MTEAIFIERSIATVTTKRRHSELLLAYRSRYQLPLHSSLRAKLYQ